MKKYFYLVVMVLIGMQTKARVVDVKVYDDCSKNGYTKVIQSGSSLSKSGTAAVNSTSGRTSCDYVQLWAGGPKWATFNVGATITDYGNLTAGTDPTSGNEAYYNTANVGGLYAWNNPNLNGRKTIWTDTISTGINDVATTLWGSNWKTPTYQQLHTLICNKTTWTWCDGSTTQYVSGCTLTGYKVSGVGDYADYSIFLPAAGYFDYTTSSVSNAGSTGNYWGADGRLYFTSRSYSIKDQYLQNGRSLRAVLGDNAVVQPVNNNNEQSANSVTLTLKAKGCSASNVITCPAGQQLQISAEATLEGNSFSRWSDGNTDNPRTITVSSNMTLTAEFSSTTSNESLVSIYDDCSRNGVQACLYLTNGHEYVDLGLSVYWATCNVGATTPEGHGDYFAWGETTTKFSYNKSTYTYNDNPTILPLSNDAAHVNLGGSWRMPTKEEWDELITYCTCTWTNINEVDGYRISNNKTTNSIYIPVTGVYAPNLSMESNGIYWTSSGYNSSESYNGYFGYGFIACGEYKGDRAEGRAIRAVCPKTVTPSGEEVMLTLLASGCSTPNTYTCSKGQQLQISAEATLEGNSFSRWSDGHTDNPRTITVSSDTTLTAIFISDTQPTIFQDCALNGISKDISVTATATQPTLTIYSNGCSTPNIFTCSEGQEVYMSAIPQDHYDFSQWNDGNTDNPRTVTVNSNMAYMATFAPKQYTISTPTTVGQVTGGGTYTYGTQVQLTAIADAHSTFVQWSDGVTDNPRTITVAGDTTYSPIFAVDQYTITLSAQNGTTSGAGKYNYGTQTFISATANYGYHFAQWSDGNTDNPRAVTVLSDTAFTALFDLNTYTISVTPSTGGTIIGADSLLYMSTCTLTAIPDAHYYFVQWSDGVKTNPRTITVMGDASYSAIFAIDQHTVSVTTNNGTVSGADKYNYGTQTFISATANYGYHFAQWSDGNTDNPRAITVSSDTAFAAICEANSYTISATAANGTFVGTGQYTYMSTCSLTAVPNDHYHFIQWSDGVKTNPRTITVMGDASYSAIFAIDQHTITVTTTNGTATGSGTYNYGSNLTLTVTPPFCYQFISWSDGNTDNPRSIVVEADATYNAFCEKMQVASGTCGDNLTWTLDLNTGVLTISGTGAMTDYTSVNQTPWYPYLSYTTFSKVIFNEGITHVGSYAFYGYSALKEVSLPHTVQTIGKYAFAECREIEKVTLGEGLLSIDDYAFSNCIRIEEITCLANRTPDVAEHTFNNVSHFAYVYVRSEYLHKYQVNMYWNVFDLKTIGAQSVSSDGQVSVEPNTDNAVFTWPTDAQAASYSLQITKDDAVFCTLTFNSLGQLIGLAFAPGRGGERTMPSAELSSNGMRFTVTGLNSATHYAYDLNVRNSAEQSIKNYTGTFHTEGATGWGDIFSSQQSEVVKIIRDNQLLIIRDCKMYNAQGGEVK